MRRFTLLFAMLLSLFWVTQVKADEITIYESATSTSYEIPIYAYNADTAGDQSEFVVPSSMLSDMSDKTITAITFYCANFSWGTKIPQYKVYMKEVNSETLSAYAGDTDATTVYEGELNLNGNQMTITLTTPYDYQGGHLLIGTKNIKAGSYVPKTSSTFYGSTASDVVCSRYSGGGKYFIPKTTFTYEKTGSIAKPTAFAVSNITSNSATLNWTAGGEETAWQLVYGTAGFDKDAATPIDLTEPSFVLTDLTDNTTYEAYVRAKVGEDVSSWTNKVSFTTLLAPITTFPWTEDFNSLTSGIPTGWDNATGTVTNNSAKWTYYATGHDGAGLRFNSYTNQTNLYNDLKTPPMNFPSGKVMQLVFWYKNPKGGDFSVYISNDGGATYTTALATGLTGQTDWKEVELSIPDSFTDNVVIVFKGTSNYGSGDAYIYLDDVTVKEQPNEPKMVVTQPTSLDFGTITETTTKTFTIANTGLATLEGINVTSSNAAFTITGAPTSLEAGASAEVTITMSTATVGNLTSDITVSATGMENVTFTVTGVVLPEGMFVVDFNDNALPEGWTNASWTFANGEATGKSYSAYLTTPKLVFSEGDILVIKAKRSDSDASDYITVQGSSDNGSTWTAYNKKISGSDGLAYPDYGTIVLSDIPTTVNKLRFVGYYVIVDEIAGLTYAPVLNVTTGDPATAVSSPASYDFGECATDAYVTYNFANAGAGTININNVTITGEGSAAYRTNWTESTAAPFELKITRTYDATRTEAQAAVITVTTSEGEFVINVTGTDKAANAPELAVDVTSLDFGKLTADDTKTVTVTNNGTGLLTVNIASDSEDFVVSAATLESIAAGESKTFDVTFKFSTNYGVKSGNITVTPTYDTEAVQTIAVTAKALDPDMWTEYFEGKALPTGWEAGENWSFADGVAKATYVYGSTKYYLTTPKLEVSATTDELAFDYKANANYVSVIIEMSKDGSAWTTCNTTPAMSTINNGDAGTATITGLEPGIYQFRFANDDYQLDNFEGFKLKAAAAHEAEVADGGLTIPVTGNQYVQYTASVKVKVTGTNDEELTVKFFIGDTQYGEAVTKNVASNTTETFEVTFTPDAAVNGNAYFTIESTDITAFQSNTVAVTIAAATVLDETVAPELTEGIVPSLLLKYTRYNGWNTICVPFELTEGILKTIFGKGWKAYEFKGYSDGTLNFETATTFVAGYPYIIYVENAQTNTDDIVLLNVNISKLTAQYDSNNDAYFRGSYAPIAAPDMNGLWGITSEGRIAKGTAEASIDGFRAYFELPSTTTGAPLLSIDGGPATRINSIDNGQLTIDNAYDLSGRRVAQPSKGLYIINGKKVVIK